MYALQSKPSGGNVQIIKIANIHVPLIPIKIPNKL